MKINPVNNIVNRYTKVQAYQVQEKPQMAAGTDKLELSDQARLFTEALSAAKRNMEATAVQKEARAAQVKGEIEQGTYHVEMNDILSKILL